MCHFQIIKDWVEIKWINMNVTIIQSVNQLSVVFYTHKKIPSHFWAKNAFLHIFFLKVTYKLRISVKEATGRKKKNYEPATLGSAALSNRTKCMFWPFNGLLLFFSLYSASASSKANLGRGCRPADADRLKVGFIYTFWSSLSSTSSILE